MAWGATSQAKQAVSQLSRETEGEGWPASRLRIRHSSLPTVCTPVVWSPDPPVKSKASFDKDCQLNRDEMPPTLVLSCPHLGFFFFLVIIYSVLCFFHSFSFMLCLTYFSRSWSNGKTLCCISDLLFKSVQLSLPLSAPLKKTYKGLVVWQWHL